MNYLKFRKVGNVPGMPCEPNTLYFVIDRNDSTKCECYLSNSFGLGLRRFKFNDAAATNFIESIAGITNKDITANELKQALDITEVSGKAVHYQTTDVSGPLLGLDINNKVQTSLLYGNSPNNPLILNSSNKIDSIFLPGSVDEIIEFNTLAELPLIGEKSKLYVVTNNSATDFGDEYRWSGTTYIKLKKAPGTADEVPGGTINKYVTLANIKAVYAPKVAGVSLDASLDIPVADLKVALGLPMTVAGVSPTGTNIQALALKTALGLTMNQKQIVGRFSAGNGAGELLTLGAQFSVDATGNVSVSSSEVLSNLGSFTPTATVVPTINFDLATGSIFKATIVLATAARSFKISFTNGTVLKQGKIIISYLAGASGTFIPASMSTVAGADGTVTRAFDGGFVYPDNQAANTTKYLVVNYFTDGSGAVYVSAMPYT